MKRRRIDPGKAAVLVLGGEVEMRGFYSRMPEPETTWGKCSACETRARILDPEHNECIKCQVQRVRRKREASA